MLNRLPDWIDPVHCAKHDMCFNAHVNQQAMKRLLEQVERPNGDVSVDIAFSRHPKLKVPQFDLKVKTQLVLTCQRTLEPFVFDVDVQVQGVYVSSLQMAEDIDDEIEVYELPQEKVSLLELVEDELLLTIPMIPRKDEAALSWVDEDVVLTAETASQAKPNPFALLGELKKNT